MKKPRTAARADTPAASRSLPDIVREITDYECFSADGPCPTSCEIGTSRTVICSGVNAGGKSIFCRVISAQLQSLTPSPEIMLISMNLRVQPDIRRAFIFGEDKSSSTGNISVQTALAGIRNSRQRTNPHILMLDEPDIGLSEGYQRALGEELCAYASALPPAALGFVLVSHSRPLIEPFLPLNPTFVRVGEDQRPTREWLANGDLPRSRADLVALGTNARERYLAVNKLLRR